MKYTSKLHILAAVLSAVLAVGAQAQDPAKPGSPGDKPNPGTPTLPGTLPGNGSDVPTVPAKPGSPGDKPVATPPPNPPGNNGNK